MGSNKLVSWIAFTLFVLAVLVSVLVILAPTLAQFGFTIPDATAWVIGVLALLSAVLGFITFKTPQGKIAAIGGVLILVAVLVVTPTSFTISR